MSANSPRIIELPLFNISTFIVAFSLAKTMSSRIFLLITMSIPSISDISLNRPYMKSDEIAMETTIQERLLKSTLANPNAMQKASITLPKGDACKTAHSSDFDSEPKSSLGTGTDERTESVTLATVTPSRSSSGDNISRWLITLCAIALTSSGIT